MESGEMRGTCGSTAAVVGLSFFFSSRRRHTSFGRDWSSDVCSSDLSLHIAGKLSGTIESARTAARMLGDDRVRTIDSESASVAIAMLGLAIQRRLEHGTSDEEIDQLAARYRDNAGLLFTVDTFEYLVRGGRVGRARGWAGELLHIKPILTIKEGEVVPVKRVRGNRKAFLEFASSFE